MLETPVKFGGIFCFIKIALRVAVAGGCLQAAANEVADIDRFLNTFVASRIGTEILTTHYLMMTDPSSDGIISVNFDPEKVRYSIEQGRLVSVEIIYLLYF